MLNLWVFLCCLFFLLVDFSARGEVVLSGSNFTFLFPDIEANFVPPVKGSGESGVLYIAEPVDACSPLRNNVVLEPNSTKSPFVLIVRGKCSFEEKIQAAETAGFEAAIVYNNEDGELISMAGNSADISIHGVFVSKDAGDTLAKYAAATAADVELWIIPSTGSPDWSILTISFISVVAMSAVLATCFFVRRHHIRRERPQSLNVREFHGLSSQLVKAIPSLIFTAVVEDNSTSSTCAICLEDYSVGDRLRVLPCSHKFHAICVDAWLTSWRTFCPICKHDLRSGISELPASESTPLLVARPVSSAIRVPSSAPSTTHIRASTSHSSSVSHHHYSLPSYTHPQLSRSQGRRFDNIFVPLSSSATIPTPQNALSSNTGSPSRASSFHQYNVSSSPTFSPLASTQSLPGF